MWLHIKYISNLVCILTTEQENSSGSHLAKENPSSSHLGKENPSTSSSSLLAKENPSSSDPSKHSFHSVKFGEASIIEDSEGSSSSGSLEMVKHGEQLSSSDDIDSLDTDVPNDYVIIEALPKTSLDEFAERIFGDITKSSACKQLAIGGVTGW